jgi:molecular chaperone Hsp33
MNTVAKRAYLQRDRVVRAMTSDGYFRLAAIKNTRVVQTAQNNHTLTPLATLLLGRALTAASLLASFLKNEERIIVELFGKGPLERIYAEAMQIGEVRGFVANPHCELDYNQGSTRLSDALGAGMMRVSRILYGNYEPVVGLVELTAGDVSTDLAYYLRQSEQIPSAVMLDVQFADDGSVSQSGGLIVQAMPGAPDTEIEAMVRGLRDLEALPRLYDDNFSPEEVLKMLTKRELHELDNAQVDFFCRCSLDRFKTSLLALGAEEIRGMQAEDQRELTCQYCGKAYHLTDSDFASLLTELRAREN